MWKLHEVAPSLLRRWNQDIKFTTPSQLDTTGSNLQCMSNVAITLDSKFTSQYIMDVVMAASIQRWNRDVIFTRSRRLYYDVAPTLRQLCKERQMWTVHSRTLAFPQLCCNIIKKICNNAAFVWYAGSILWHQIRNIKMIHWNLTASEAALQLYWNRTSHGCSPVNLLHIFKTLFPKNTFGRLLLELENYQKNTIPLLTFWVFKITTFQKIGRKTSS